MATHFQTKMGQRNSRMLLLNLSSPVYFSLYMVRVSTELVTGDSGVPSYLAILRKRHLSLILAVLCRLISEGEFSRMFFITSHK